MPVKKQKLQVPPKPSKPGVLKQYLTDKFGDVPVDSEQLQHGHILYIFTSSERSVSKTVAGVAQKFGSSVKAYEVQKICKQFRKFKRPSDPAEFKRFESVCHTCVETNTILDTGGESSSSQHGKVVADFSSVLKPNVSTLVSEKCGNCEILKRRLRFSIKSHTDIRRKHLKTMKMLRDKLKQKSVKRLNQTIKRKEHQLTQAKEKMSSDNVLCHLNRARLTIQKLKTNARKRKLYQAKNSSSSCACTPPDVSDLHNKIKVQCERIAELENDKLILEERNITSPFSKDSKQFNCTTRMFVYDAIVNQVPTKNIPTLLQKFSLRSGLHIDSVPHRITTELMARELGVISNLQVAETLMDNNNVTIGFDATTQEGVHINSVHFTTDDRCAVMAIDQLPGGTAIDYHQHIIESIDHLCSVYAEFYSANYQDTRATMLSNISNTMTDRASVNHATIELLNESLNKNLNELNCHLHPLDTIATSCRTTLKSLETESGKIFGHDCFAANIIIQMNKMRYKDGKGDPKGFVTFLDKEHLPRGLITRYRGNRLHVLFHLAGIYYVYHDTFLSFLTNGTVSCGGLQGSLRADFSTIVAKSELHVLGLIGKLFTGPWMQTFYRSAGTQIDHLDGINIARRVIGVLETFAAEPMSTLSCSTDFLGGELNLSDSVLPDTNKTVPKDHILCVLRSPPSNPDMFCKQMTACLTSCITVLQRQYKRYFNVQITDELHLQTKSARTHNIDAEEIMGMYSAAQKRAPNATLDYLSSRIRAQKNSVMDYIDHCDDVKQEKLIRFAIPLARKLRSKRLKRHNEMRLELIKRENRKLGQKEASQRKKIEKKVKTLNRNNLDTEFPELDDGSKQNILDILDGKVIGRNICHTWCDSDTHEKTVYSGKIEKMKRRNSPLYVVAYWPSDSDYNQAIDYDISKFELVTDYICDDLVLS